MDGNNKISIAENRRPALDKQLAESIADLNTAQSAQNIKLYQNPQDGEICIHLSWNNGRAEFRGSSTGLFLAHLLKEFGLTSHSVWTEEEQSRLLCKLDKKHRHGVCQANSNGERK